MNRHSDGLGGTDVRLVVARDGRDVMGVPLGGRLLRIGRRGDNDLVLSDPAVSGSHASVWRDPTGVWIVDFGSRNGTWLNERRILGPERLSEADRVRLGEHELRAEGLGRDGHGPGRYLLEDVDTGVRVPILGGRIRIGAGSDADLVSEHVPSSVTVLLAGGTEVLAVSDAGELNTVIGQIFEVPGHRFRVTRAPRWLEATDLEERVCQYRLDTSLEGPTGAYAVLTDLRTGVRWRCETETRAVLLFVLARQLSGDRAAGLPPDEEGWCADEDVVRAVWGRAKEYETNKLHVLALRLRREIEAAGFDASFIEKRRRGVRVRLTSVIVS